MKDGTIYKMAPADAALGDVLAVSDEEWQQISPQLMPAPEITPVPDITPVQVAEQQAPTVAPAEPSIPEQKEISIAERIQGVFRR
jgi:hypothetical protein